MLSATPVHDLKSFSTGFHRISFRLYQSFVKIRHIITYVDYSTFEQSVLNNLLFYCRTRIICRGLSRAPAAYDGYFSSRRHNFNFRVGEQSLNYTLIWERAFSTARIMPSDVKYYEGVKNVDTIAKFRT